MAKAAQFEGEDFVGEKPNMAPSMAHLNFQEELRGSNLALNKRSMVLDEDRFEEQFLRCTICRERFNNDKLPRMLPCHHSFCNSCIEHLFATATELRNNFHSSIRLPISAPVSAVSVSCPTCRANFVATDENIRRLPTDHRVVQLMDFVHHTERYTVTFCSKHSLQPLNFFCEPCIKPVCRDCTVLDHKEADGHLVMDLEDALAKYTPVLDSAITEMDGEAVCLEEKRIALEAVTTALDKIRDSLLEEVKTCMARLRHLLDEREKALEAKVHEEAGKEQAKLVEKAELLETRRHTLMEQSDRLKRAKGDNNVEEMFRIHQEVREYRAGPPMRVREVDDGLLTSFMLNTRDEAMLSSRINNFGDVTSKVETTLSRLKGGKSAPFRSNSLR
ncbi:tripartite motif-containing protein 2 [Plakobranchus ocellatus]|uniref:Tripartite motif-containing protein 2 n=1 Tax=Plakobranchus ocellatus TaxID=259542 RepID=A0AAV3YDL4_9GAST|nr:tripartite motif-containing protein 2 [Plakobranchus ocellatus]